MGYWSDSGGPLEVAALMKTWVINRLYALRATFWFVPMLFAVGAVALAVAALNVDAQLARSGVSAGWLYAGTPEAARSMVIMLAGSMIGIAGVTFSITIVALSLTSAQFGSRLLRNFLRDPSNQIALGTFIATFLYCLMVLRGIVETQPVPAVAVTGAVALSVTSIGVLVYFFHHVSTSIQAGEVVAAVARDLDSAIDRFSSDWGSQERAEQREPTARRVDGGGVPGDRSGYVQAIDYERLLEMAEARDVIIQVPSRAGDFVHSGTALVSIEPEGRLEDGDAEAICRAFVIGSQPTEEQDLEYFVRRLVEVALRALSPGINDPFTAMTCIDWLGVGLARLAESGLPRSERRDADGRLRLLLDPLTFEVVADTALTQIREAGVGHVAVAIQLLDTLRAIAPRARTRAHAEVLRAHADAVLAGALDAAPIHSDCIVLKARHAATRRVLEGVIAEPNCI
jgi:uncharacterized membrane protein